MNKILVAAALTVAALAIATAPATAAPPPNATMSFDGVITSVAPHGNACTYTARLAVNVASTAGGTPDGFTGTVRARWSDDCQPGVNGTAMSGTADIRLQGIASTAGGSPDGFRFRGTATNVASTASGNPDGFKFRGTAD